MRVDLLDALRVMQEAAKSLEKEGLTPNEIAGAMWAIEAALRQIKRNL